MGEEMPGSLEGVAVAGWSANVGSRETAYEFVYRVLRRAVLDGSLKEGARLYQTEISRLLGVSTTPVREALHKLTSEGLIDFGASRGAEVHVLSPGEWREILNIRNLLEPEALRRSAERIDDREIDEAERILSLMDGGTDPVVWVDLNRQFHCIHYNAAESPRLAGILTILLDACATYMVRSIVNHPDCVLLAQAGHYALVEGLRHRDGDALQRASVAHLEAFHAAVFPSPL